MRIYLGADHRGFNLKEEAEEFLLNLKYEVHDLGNSRYEPEDDYPDFAERVAKRVGSEEGSFGILVCGSGVGVEVVANKFDGVRAFAASSPMEARVAREDDDINVLALAADLTTEAEALEIIHAFLSTPFKNEERHIRRLEKIEEIEKGN